MWYRRSQKKKKKKIKKVEAEGKANTGKEKWSFVSISWAQRRVCVCVEWRCGWAERKRKGNLQGSEAEMNAATCWHGNQQAYCRDWFLALIGPINPSGLTGISTLLQFQHLISGLSGIQRHHTVKQGITDTWDASKQSPPAKAPSRAKITSVLADY